MSRKGQGLTAVFAVPLVIGGLSLFGLIGALLDDGAWDWIGAVLLGLTVVVVAWMRIRAARQRRA